MKRLAIPCLLVLLLAAAALSQQEDERCMPVARFRHAVHLADVPLGAPPVTHSEPATQ